MALPTTKRRTLMHDYLREVAKDLLMQGVIRKQQGATFMELLHQEPAAMVSSIFRDLSDAGFSVGTEIVGGLAKAMFSSIIGG